MNIITRVKNNFEYAYYRKLRDKAIVKAEKHINDEDDHEFKKWAKLGLKYLRKCLEIPIK